MEALLLRVLAPLRARADAALEAVVPTWRQSPAPLGDAMEYAVQSGGKRLRPILVFAAYDASGGTAPSYPAPMAAALEMVHAYSLAHDDLPSMDDDDERRGRPTLHIAYGEPMAILTGDALLTEAFSVIATAALSAEHAVAGVRSLAEAAGPRGMVGGQALDILEPEPEHEELRRMHAAKTGALFRCACELGAIASGAEPAVRASLIAYGERLGEAFQISDDLVDFLDIETADDHEHHVNMASVLGPRGVVKRVESAATEARAAIRSLSGPTKALELLIEWVERRAQDALDRAGQ